MIRLLLDCIRFAARAEGAEPRVEIRSAKVGLPSASGDGHISKFAAWTPIELELELFTERNEPLTLSIETPDCDGITTALTLPLKLERVHRDSSSATFRDGLSPPGLRHGRDHTHRS